MCASCTHVVAGDFADRTPFLSHLDGRTTREVSEATGLSESTVRVHLFRGLRRLRTLMSREHV